MKNDWREMNEKNDKEPSFNNKGLEDAQKEEDKDVAEEKISSTTKHSIYIVGGEKGGVGKSFFARCMIDYFTSKKWNDQYVLVEADSTINDVSSIYKENVKSVIFSDNTFLEDEPDLIVELAERKSVVVNLPSNVCKQFDAWIERSHILSLDIKECYDHLFYFFVSDGCFRSIDRFVKQLDHYGNKDLSHCLILNPGRLTQGANFSYLNEYKPLLETLKKHKVPVLQVPKLKANLQFECDQHLISYRDYAQSHNIMTKKKIKGFLDEVDSLFNSVFLENINEPVGLEKIIRKQMKDYKAGSLPFKTMAELFAS